MTSTRTITAAIALTGALIAAPAIAETTSPGASSTSSSSASSSSSSSAKSSSPNTATNSRVGAPITLRVDSKGNIDKGALPKDSTLLGVEELRTVIPGLQSATFADGTLTLTIKGESADNRSEIMVSLKRFGKKSDITKAWNAEKKDHEARAAKNPGLYTFAGAGKNGVADSFSDGTTTHVLLTNGDAAGEVWFSGIGFTSLGDTHASARKAYRDNIVPKLTKVLGDKVHAGGPGKTPSSSPSPSSSRSSSTSSASSSSKS